MRKGGGKAKGSEFERRVAKELSLWLTVGKDSKQLIRSVLSGGWHGRQTEATTEGWRQVGDLAPNGPAGEAFRRLYAIECKHRRSIDLLSLWTRTADKDSIFVWWDKLAQESAKAGVQPILIFRMNGRPIMVMMPERHSPLGVRYAYFNWLKDSPVVFPFEQLLEQDPQDFMARE